MHKRIVWKRNVISENFYSCDVEWKLLSFVSIFDLRGHFGNHGCLRMLYGIDKKNVPQNAAKKGVLKPRIKNKREIALRGYGTRDSVFQKASVAKIRCHKNS